MTTVSESKALVHGRVKMSWHFWGLRVVIHRSLTGFSNETWKVIKHYYSQLHKLMVKKIRLKLSKSMVRVGVWKNWDLESTLDFWMKWVLLQFLCFWGMGIAGVKPTGHQSATEQQNTLEFRFGVGRSEEQSKKTKKQKKPKSKSTVFYIKQWNVDFFEHFC